MKKFNAKSLMILSLAGLLAACNGGSGSTFVIGNDVGYGLAGRTAKKTYNALIGAALGDLNYMTTAESASATHFANFVDGLLLHNEFGVLEKNLATKVVSNADSSEFTFTVRDNVPWVKHDGTQYSATINGKSVKQYVQPEDWVTTAKAVCTYNNQSSLQYLIGNFVFGAQEYYHYTFVQYKAEVENDRKYISIFNDPTKLAKELNTLIKTNAPTVWAQQYADGDNPIEPSMIEAIKNGSRFGVKADAEKRTVTYTLNLKASFFPTLFTYSCYLPVNQYFLKEVGFSKFGKSKETLLYNGPYLLGHNDEKEINYKKNPTYWNEDIFVLDEVHYAIPATDIGYSYTREEFEAGRIDGFSVSSNDSVGWAAYITGPDGSGTMEKPYDGRVNSRLLDTIGNMYGSNIVMSRGKNGSKSYYTGGTADTLKNTERALSLTDVRKAVMAALPYEEYFKRYGAEEIQQTQQLVHTYVPKGFVINDDGKDYVEDNYLEVYAEAKGIEKGSFDTPFDPNLPESERTAAWYNYPGQYTSRIIDQAGMNELLDNVETAISLYNDDPNHTDITLPINIEYFSVWDADPESKTKDTEVIRLMNERLNRGTSTTSLFKVVPTDKINSGNYESASREGAFDYAAVQWGWGADYGDPLTFMNTYRKGNGDWKDIFPFIGDEYTANFTVENGELVESDLLEEYTELVDAGAAETDDINARFNYFAQAEYLLINELSFYKPQVNNGQGWAVSVSLAAGYYMPSASFGLANDRLTGMYVLTMDNMLDGDARNAAREAQEAAKAAYVAEHGSINIYD